MLNYNEILGKRFIVYEGTPFEVLDAHIFRMQQRKPVNQTKLKNLFTGKVTEITFHQADKVEEADIHTREIKYLYTTKGQFWFCEANNPAKRFSFESDIVGEGGRFLRPNSMVDALTWERGEMGETGERGALIGIRLPIKVELKVTEAPPAIKGDTAKGGTKVITLETGTTLNAPMFISEGDVVRINTETGEYVERAN
ncbi:MAG: elongation factor P [bacterium]|nr:elongation factor P [bacterium]